jgi:Protein of unknown function (DUF2752)
VRDSLILAKDHILKCAMHIALLRNRWFPGNPNRASAFNTLVSGAIVALVALNLPLLSQIPHICLFEWLTGRPCPGCGMTRAAVELLRGHWIGAFHANPAIFVFGAGYLATLTSAVAQLIVSGKILEITASLANWTTTVALLAVWLVRV